MHLFKALEGHSVKIEWRDTNADYWPYFRVLKVKAKKQRIKLKGEDYPPGAGRGTHDGSTVWVDAAEIADIGIVLKGQAVAYALPAKDEERSNG